MGGRAGCRRPRGLDFIPRVMRSTGSDRNGGMFQTSFLASGKECLWAGRPFRHLPWLPRWRPWWLGAEWQWHQKGKDAGAWRTVLKANTAEGLPMLWMWGWPKRGSEGGPGGWASIS